MAEFDKPDQTRRVEVDGYGVTTYAWGAPEAEAVVLLSGGPGLPCKYLVAPHLALVDEGYRVVSYDQLGTGASDRPADRALWTIERAAREVETVRAALGLARFHLLGHSWGGWLGIEYAVTFPDAIASFVIADSAADIPHLVGELGRLRAALGPETVRMMQRREAENTIEHEEYKAAITLLNHRHVCRLDDWPAPLVESLADWNREPYETVQGPNEFLYTGNLRDWRRLEAMAAIRAPCLVVVGAYDELTPACALLMHKALARAEMAVFRESSHTPFYEEPAAYFARLVDFLRRHPL